MLFLYLSECKSLKDEMGHGGKIKHFGNNDSIVLSMWNKIYDNLYTSIENVVTFISTNDW